jgi:hypothetical protein
MHSLCIKQRLEVCAPPPPPPRKGRLGMAMEDEPEMNIPGDEEAQKNVARILLSAQRLRRGMEYRERDLRSALDYGSMSRKEYRYLSQG